MPMPAHLIEIGSRTRGRAGGAGRRLRAMAPAILQTGAAAAAAWLVALLVLADPRPTFASIAAVIAVGATHGVQRQRAVQLVGGVVVGITVADLLIHLIGTGPWQMALLVMLAMAAAVLLGGGELVVGEAPVSAILLVSLSPGAEHGFTPNRILEAVIGGAVALVVTALLFPPDPALQVGRAAQAVFGRLGGALERVADALARGDAGRAEAALAEARAIDDLVEELGTTLASGRETARLAPPRRGALSALERYEATAGHLDLAVRNARVLARHALRLVRADGPAPAELVTAAEELAAAVWALAGAYEDPQRARDARRLATRAAARVADLHALGYGLAVSEALTQIRSTAVDLVRAADVLAAQEDPAGADMPTEELLAVPVAA
jgi:uncharacterized membrane protein YgaE (UPF0421/DUF939 family)